MKIDFKSILILILLAFALFFGYKWYFTDTSDYKNKLKELQKEYQLLEESKKENNLLIEKYKFELDSIMVQDSLNAIRISELESKVFDAEKNAAKSKKEFDKLQKQLEETRKKIEEFKKNPPNRTGDALLESIKNKTKK
jgi:predicted  nucleic acid-binding Zn-ribbon protein